MRQLRRILSRSRTLKLLVVCCGALAIAIASVSPALASKAAPTQQPEEVLQISSISPWVSASGEFQLRFEPTVEVPPGSILTYTIHQGLQPTRSQTLRDKVDGVIDGASAGKVLQSPVSKPLTEYGDPAAGSVLTIPIRSTPDQDRLRVLLPKAGIHPLELVLTSAEGPEIWSQVVFLNRLPRNYSTQQQDPSAVAVTLLVPIETAPSLNPGGLAAFGVEDRSRIDAASTLLEEVPEAPLTLGLRPNTLDGLVRSKKPWAERFMNALTSALSPPESGPAAAAQPSLLSMPYVHVSTAGLVSTGAIGDLQREIALGDRVTRQITSTQTNQGIWALDDTLSPESAQVLAGFGNTAFLVDPAQLERPANLTEQQTMTAGSQLGKDSGLRALAYDTLVSARFADSGVDPALRAHQVISIIMAAWFTARSPGFESFSAGGAALGSVIVIPTTIDPAVISALEPSLLSGGPLQVLANGAPLGPASTKSAEPVVQLAPVIAPDEAVAVTQTTETRRQITAYRTMTASPESEVELWTRMNAQTLATGLNAAQRLGLHNSVRSQLAANLAEIELPPPRQVTITGRSTNIPLRFRNNLPYEIKLRLIARSTRLAVAGGDSQEIVLAPGENRIDLAVTVRAPGESDLRIKLLSPNEELEIGQIELPVRATAISGVGAALSVISILFLLLWWTQAHRRRKREASRTAGDHPALNAPLVPPAN